VPQVSLLHPSFRAPGLDSSGFPKSSRVQLSLSRCADDVSRATPFRVFWLYRRSSCGQTRLCDPSALPASPRRVSPAMLGLSRRRCVPEHPRAQHPPVLAGDRVASFPASRLLQRLRLPSSGCPRNSAPPNPLLTPPRASPGTASSGCADGDRPGRPALSCPSAMPIGGSPGSPGFHAFRPFRIRFLGLPRLCAYGWVDDVSPTSLELCILVYPACEFPSVPGSCARWLCRG
jgi:hypothetical protein